MARRRGVAVAAALAVAVLLGTSLPTSSALKFGKGTAGHQYYLSEPKLLLPLTSSDRPIKHVLRASGGCYTWLSRRTDIAVVQPVGDDHEPVTKCSALGEVTVKWRGSDRASTVIIAREQESGHEIRCDVFVDKVSRIGVFTTTRTVYLEDAPEVLEVQAYDAEGNLFTNLDMMAFQWRLLPTVSDGRDASTILDVVDYISSRYDASDAIYQLEKQHLRGCTLLVKAISAGMVKVVTAVSDPMYSAVAEASVELAVMEKLEIQPYEAHILVGQSLHYSVIRKSEERNEEMAIKMPSTQYYLKIVQEDVALLDTPSSVVTGQGLGSTEIVLFDNTLEYDSSLQPKSIIHVVRPEALSIVIEPYDRDTPGSRDVLQLGRTYEITLQLKDSNHHVIHQDEYCQFEFEYDGTVFEMLSQTANKSYHHVRVLKSGPTIVKGTFLELTTPSGKSYVPEVKPRGERHLQIYEPITIHPHLVILPWSPNDPPYQFPLKATGGSRLYEWASLAPETVSVTTKGVVTGLSQGNSTVRAYDQKSTLHYDEAVVVVSPPTDLEIPPCRIECPIGSDLQIPIAVFDAQRRPFDDCSKLGLVPLLATPGVFHVGPTANFTRSLDRAAGDHSCGSFRLTADRAGSTRFVVEWGGLEATVTVYAYPPLRIISPVPSALVTYGSSKNVIFEGGPQPLPADPKSYWQRLASADTAATRISAVGGTASRQYQVTCAQIGTQQLTLRVGNRKTKLNPFPRVETATTVLRCEHPHALVLTPLINNSARADVDSKECAALRTALSPSQPIHQVLATKQLHVAVAVINDKGERFDNFSSASIAWAKDVPDATVAFGGDEIVGGNVSRLLQLGASEAGATIQATLSGYVVPASLAPAPALPAEEITERLSLQLLAQHTVRPTVVSLFNHPDNEVRVTILHGSGIFRSRVVSGSRALRATLSERTLVVSPRKPGEALVHVWDACLAGSTHQPATVVISDVYTLDVQMLDKVQVGHTIVASVCARDAFGNEFDESQYKFINLTATSSAPFVSLAPLESDGEGTDSTVTTTTAGADADAAPHGDPQRCKGKRFRIGGVEVGTSVISFAAVKASPDGKVSSSNSHPREVQVFPPLVVTPKQVVLMPGATFQVEWTGGPSDGQVTVVFSTINGTVAGVDHDGVILAAHVGRTKLLAEAAAVDPQTGRRLVFSQDTVRIRVAKLTGVKVVSSTTSLIAGSVINAHAEGLAGETPFSFGTLPLRFHWTTSNGDVLATRSPYHRAGVDLREESDFSVQVVAHHAGKASLSVAVSALRDKKHYIAPHAHTHGSLQFEVFEPFRVLTGSSLLLPYDSRFQILTNRDQQPGVHFRVLEPCQAKGSGDVATITRSGLLRTAMSPGSVTVLATYADRGFNQSVAVVVEVASIAQLSIHPDNLLWPPSQRSVPAPFVLPLGLTDEFNVRLHDRMGRLFDTSEGVSLQTTFNRADILRVRVGASNGTYLLTATNLGEAVFRVSARDEYEQSRVDDYIRVRVKPAITPSDPLIHVGCTVHFSTLLAGPEGSGEWVSLQPDVFAFPHRDQPGTALSTGVAKIIFNASETVTYTHIHVAQVRGVAMDTTGIATLTNVVTEEGDHAATSAVLVPLSFHAPEGRTFSMLDGTSQNIFFTCRLLPAKLGAAFEVLSVFNETTKTAHCSIKAVDSLPRRLHQSALTLQVTAGDEQNSYAPAVQSKELPFVPAFWVTAPEAVFAAGSDVATFTLNSPAQHELQMSCNGRTASAKPRRSIPSLSKWDFGSFVVDELPTTEAGQREFEVALLSASMELPATLVLTSRATGQTLSLPLRMSEEAVVAAKASVYPKLFDTKRAGPITLGYLFSIELLIAIILLFLVLAVYMLWGRIASMNKLFSSTAENQADVSYSRMWAGSTPSPAQEPRMPRSAFAPVGGYKSAVKLPSSEREQPRRRASRMSPSYAGASPGFNAHY